MNIKFLGKIILSLCVLFFIGCSSPEQKLAAHIENGFEALEENQPDKALASFRKALQINAKSNKALWGMILTFEKQGNLRKVFDLTRQLVEQEPSNIDAHFKLANLYLMSDMTDYFDDQIAILDKLTKNNPELLALKAEKLLKENNFEQAKHLAEKALVIDPDNMSGLMILAKIDGRNGNLEHALGFIEQAIVKHPKQSSLYLAKITLLRDGLMTEQIASVYEKLIALNPTNFTYKKELALFLVQQQQYAQAEKLLKDFLKTDPKNIESQMGLVKLTLATKGEDEAKKLLSGFVKASPESMPLKFAQYDFFKQLGEFDQAKTLIEKLISEAKDIDDKLKASAFYADDLLELGLRPKASKLVDEVINKDPKNRDGLMVKAKLAMFDQKFNSAIGIYRNILADFPNDTAAMIALGKAYEYSGTMELANETYFLAYQTNLGVDEIREGYIDFLLKNKLNERAEQLVQEWVNASPNNPYFLKKLALLKSNNGKFEEAEKIANKMTVNPRLSAFGYQLQGDILSLKGQQESAAESYLKAFNLEKENAIFMGNVVDTYLKSGKQAQAIALLNNIDIKAPYYYEAQLILAKLHEQSTPVNTTNIYTQLIKMAPDRPEAYVNWSNLLSQNGVLDQSITIIENCIAINKQNYECQFALAERYTEQKRYDKAIAIYQKQAQLHPYDLLMRNNLASLLIDHAPNPESTEYAFYLAQTFANTDQPILKDTYGWAAFKVGKLNEAVKALEFATQKAPKEGLFHYHLAKVYQANKQDKKARESSMKARNLHTPSSDYSLSDLN